MSESAPPPAAAPPPPAAPTGPAEPTPPAAPTDPDGRSGRPGRRGQLAIAVLCALLGFGVAVQVHSSASSSFPGARSGDLVAILDDLGSRSARLRGEIEQLRTTSDALRSGADRTGVALAETRRRARELAVLAGTVPYSGQGIEVSVTDPRARVGADVLLDAVEELRDAGAGALQISGTGGSVRLVAASYLLDAAGGGLLVDRRRLGPPYRLLAVGDPATLSAAMMIPGGVVDAVRAAGGTARVTRPARVAVTALRALATPRYARSVPSTAAG